MRSSSSRSSSLKPKLSRQSTSSHRSSLAAQKTEIIINVYDLLPPGKLSTLLWMIGGSLLHTGIVIGRNREYAYGGHDRPNVSGVYYTRPRLEPPGGTFRSSLLQGFTFLSPEELDTVIRDASAKFQGTNYNLLTNNCNHFTSYLCQKLTGKPAPAWINRAASIGLALPCVVPRDWIAPPDYDTAEGDLVVEDEDDEDERSTMLRRERERERARLSDDELAKWDDEMESIGRRSSSWRSTEGPRPVTKDTSGRRMPPAERAPLPRV